MPAQFFRQGQQALQLHMVPAGRAAAHSSIPCPRSQHMRPQHLMQTASNGQKAGLPVTSDRLHWLPWLPSDAAQPSVATLLPLAA